MLHLVLGAAGAGALAILEGLALLGLWTGKGPEAVCAGLAFVLALNYGHLGDGLRRRKAPSLTRGMCTWTVLVLSLLGALYLPMGSALGWKLTLGVEKVLIKNAAFLGAGLGLTLLTPALLAGKNAPLPRRGKRGLPAAFTAGALACLLLAGLGYFLPLPHWLSAWAAPVGFLLIAMEDTAALQAAAKDSGTVRLAQE